MRLMMQQAGEPDRAGLYLSRDCWYAWATLPFLARSIRNPDDIDTNGPDHAADCLSYAVSHATKHQQVAAAIPTRRRTVC